MAPPLIRTTGWRLPVPALVTAGAARKIAPWIMPSVVDPVRSRTAAGARRFSKVSSSSPVRFFSGRTYGRRLVVFRNQRRQAVNMTTFLLKGDTTNAGQRGQL